MVQEVTTKSWGSRLISALWGIVIGLALIIGSFVLVFWNEGHGLHTAQSLAEAQKVLISVPATPIEAKNNLQVVYFSGIATTENTLNDKYFGISEKAIGLNRKVEMYQWEQHSDTKTESQVGGSEKEVTTYTYKPTWSETVIDSAEFKDPTGHQNPATMPIKSKEQYADDVTVGGFTLPSDLIVQIKSDTSVDLSKINLDALKTKLHKNVQISDDHLYVGENPDSPQVGDLKITLTHTPPQTVSIIAQQTDNTLQPFMAPAGQSVSLLAMGKQSPQQMIADALSANSVMMWLLRAASLLMMIIGFALLMGPIVVLADVLPFLGSVAGFMTGLVAVLVGLSLWTIAIAIAWFAVRPLLAIGLVTFIVGLSYCIIRRKKIKQ